MAKTDKPEGSAATQAAEKLKPDETRRVKTPQQDVLGVRIGDTVSVQLAPGRKLRKPEGGFYEPSAVYLLVADVTLLRRLRQGDWVIQPPTH